MKCGGIHSDNLTLIPASELPFMDEWRRMANALPLGDALLVIPECDGSFRSSMASVAAQLRRRGRHITAVSARRSR